MKVLFILVLVASVLEVAVSDSLRRGSVVDQSPPVSTESRELHCCHDDHDGNDDDAADVDEDYDIQFAFTLSAVAGLSTVAGSLVTFYTDIYDSGKMSMGLALAAGVMVTASSELLATSKDYFKDGVGRQYKTTMMVLCFVGGVFMAWLLDSIVHKMGGSLGHIGDELYSPPAPAPVGCDNDTMQKHSTGGAVVQQEVQVSGKEEAVSGGTTSEASSGTVPSATSATSFSVEEESGGGGVSDPAVVVLEDVIEVMDEEERKRAIMKKLSLVTATAIAIHNFSEGMAVFLAALSSPGLGLALCVGMVFHNVPEGISVALPVYYATGKRTTALKWTIWTALSEPLGALFSYLVLVVAVGEFGDTTFGVLYAMTGGIMMFITFHELIPTALKHDSSPHHINFTTMIFIGMIFMHSSLILFEV